MVVPLLVLKEDKAIKSHIHYHDSLRLFINKIVDCLTI